MPLSGTQNQHFDHVRCATTLHGTSFMYEYTHFWRRVVPNHGGWTGVARGLGTVSLVYSGLITIFVFDILQIPSGCIQCGANTCTPLLRARCNAKTAINRVVEGEQGKSATNVVKDSIVETFLEDEDKRLRTVGHPHHSCTLPVFNWEFNRKQF